MSHAMQNAARSDMPASVIRLGALIRQHSDRFYEIFKECGTHQQSFKTE